MCPIGGLIPGPVLQMLAAKSILQGRMLHGSSAVEALASLPPPGAFYDRVVVARFRGAAGRGPWRPGDRNRTGRDFLADKIPGSVLDTSIWQATIAAYLAAVALDEIDFRKLLGRIADRRFQRIAMSLGDGLVCTDRRA